MARGADIPELSVDQVDRWVLTARPSADEVVTRLAEVRRLAHDARIAEAHLVGYVRDLEDLDEADEDPAILKEADWADE